MGYEGITPGQIPEKVYTLSKIYFEDKPPTGVHVHLRRYRVADIPADEDAFAEWLRQIWIEKDAMMAEFYSRGRFPIGGVIGLEQTSPLEKEGRVQLPVRLNSLLDLTQIWFYLIPHMLIVHLAMNLYSGPNTSSLLAYVFRLYSLI